MAVRTPLYLDSGNLKDFTTAQVTEIVNQVIYQFSISPSVSLSILGSGGNLGSIADTRLQAGASATNVSAFPGEGSTAEPSVVTVNYSKINQTVNASTPTADDGKAFPVYRTASNDIQAMSLQDMKDTFLHPAIDSLVSGSTGTAQGGTYHVTTSSSVAGSTNIGTCFLDTRANTGAYSAGSIPETLDQPTTITSYYLHKRDAGSAPSFTLPFVIDGSNNLQQMTTTNFNTLYDGWIRKTAASSSDGFALSYNINGTGNNRGSGMVDTRLNGSGAHNTRQVGDDYRAQEFPNGTAATINTYFLKINKS